jgi:transposase
MKRGGRTLDHGTLETIRLMAVERVRDGEAPSEVIAAYGFSRTSIYRWLKAASKPGLGLRGLRARPAAGRPRSLTTRQERQVFRWINGRDPRQYGLDFGLWTRSVVADLIERKGRHPAWPDRGGRIAGQARPDPAEAAPTRLSA